MVVIFGWGGGNTKDLGEIAPTTCPRCRNQVFLHHVKSDKQISLYFVPLATYAAEEYLLCPVCRAGLQVRPEHRQAVTSMASATRLFRRGGLPMETYQGQVARFWSQLGRDPGGAQLLHGSPTIPAPATAGPQAADGAPAAGPSLAEQLAGLARLRDDGVLTEEEFAAAKRRLLGA
jgi:uncharacterized protein YbaR (Trm112 family)